MICISNKNITFVMCGIENHLVTLSTVIVVCDLNHWKSFLDTKCKLFSSAYDLLTVLDFSATVSMLTCQALATFPDVGPVADEWDARLAPAAAFSPLQFLFYPFEGGLSELQSFVKVLVLWYLLQRLFSIVKSLL